MRVETRTMAGTVMRGFAQIKAFIASSVCDLTAARARRRAEEREFYRKLRLYCRAHGISPVCEDDWKTRA